MNDETELQTCLYLFHALGTFGCILVLYGLRNDQWICAMLGLSLSGVSLALTHELQKRLDRLKRKK